jgi:hypothetical protein
MITSAADERIKEAHTTDDELIVAFVDGRTLSVPLVWYPRLLHASPEQRSDWRLIADGEGIHWPQIDEDLSAAGLLRGIPASAARPPRPSTPDDLRAEKIVQSAQDFYGDSLGRIKGQIQKDRAVLESLMEQSPPGAQAQIQEMIDSYTEIESTLDQSTQDLGVTDTVNQALQQAQDAAGQVTVQAQEAAGGAAQQAQETAGQAAQQAQDVAAQAADQASAVLR